MKRALRNSVDSSKVFDCLVGHYKFDGATVPYITAHMTALEASRYLKTPEDLPNWVDRETEIEALFQRQLDHERVERKIVPYLRESQSPKFFNAITIALVPFDSASGKLMDFEEEGLKAPTIEKPSSEHLNSIGPVCLGTWHKLDVDRPETYRVGEFCWNIDQVVCVAIDGQHRLAALKSLDQQTAENIVVCVIFLLPAPSLGYEVGGDPRYPSLKLMRSVFIDLNKHAQVVKRSRLILLDDQDPHSLIVRGMIAPKLSDADVNPTADGRLPLNLVDWHTDEAKFDSGPYLTTVLALDRIATTLLQSKPISDWTAHKKIRRQIDGFGRYGVDTSSMIERLQMASEEDNDVSWHNVFQYNSEEAEEIAKTVGGFFAKIVSKVFYGVDSYRRLIQVRQEYHSLSAKFTNWYEAYYANSKSNSTQAFKVYNMVEKHILREEKRTTLERWEYFLNEEVLEIKDGLLFKVIFQDAIFLALRLVWSLGIYDKEVWTDKLVEVLNEMERASLFKPKEGVMVDGRRSEFWLGSGLKIGDLSIDFTDAGRSRIADWLRFALLIKVGLETLDLGGPDDYQDLMTELSHVMPDFYHRLEDLENSLTFGNAQNKGAMLRIANVLHDDEEEELINKEAQKQFLARAQRLIDTFT